MMLQSTRRSELNYQWADATHAWWPAGRDGIAVPVQVVVPQGAVTYVRNFNGDVHDVPSEQVSQLRG